MGRLKKGELGRGKLKEEELGEGVLGEAGYGEGELGEADRQKKHSRNEISWLSMTVLQIQYDKPSGTFLTTEIWIVQVSIMYLKFVAKMSPVFWEENPDTRNFAVQICLVTGGWISSSWDVF